MSGLLIYYKRERFSSQHTYLNQAPCQAVYLNCPAYFLTLSSVSFTNTKSKMSTVTKQFYLVGDNPSTARSIEVDSNQTLKSLQEVLGDEFHIIQPSGKKPNIIYACRRYVGLKE